MMRKSSSIVLLFVMALSACGPKKDGVAPDENVSVLDNAASNQAMQDNVLDGNAANAANAATAAEAAGAADGSASAPPAADAKPQYEEAPDRVPPPTAHPMEAQHPDGTLPTSHF